MSGTDKPLIKNIIVVMMENRSYDNVLGWLYGAGNKAPYDSPPPGQVGLNGLTGGETNPASSGGTLTVASQTTPTQVSTSKSSYSATVIPAIDPGERFCDMAQQITGSTIVPDSNPYTKWPIAADTLMKGFVTNYEIRPGDPNLQDVMNYLTPEQVPVTRAGEASVRISGSRRKPVSLGR